MEFYKPFSPLEVYQLVPLLWQLFKDKLWSNNIVYEDKKSKLRQQMEASIYSQTKIVRYTWRVKAWRYLKECNSVEDGYVNARELLEEEDKYEKEEWLEAVGSDQRSQKSPYRGPTLRRLPLLGVVLSHQLRHLLLSYSRLPDNKHNNNYNTYYGVDEVQGGSQESDSCCVLATLC